ncbi:TDT family transporter [Ancylobacter dichloromethanicus]|uniref:C4-dicarboxylate ABC transporter n=1 Tax=Ancylobacter dichloromethanicus TaxID=518825 RepID=A0A9W6N1Z0_9HYPH|nr:TDT family transporter [Ancylobacter dichloromethanicus]MBS7552929.1 TDT family transporter [Ancylobacter dichloromethanicus]GLK74532.1 C4-dicarboxylate ABC transporter [Ancylobacter dichloromethanicus]
MTYLPRHFEPAVITPAKPLAEIIRNFTPNWFTVTMGTGALALVLNQFPLPLPALHALAVGLWLLNIALFALFALLYGARWVMFFAEAKRVFQHPVMSMFFGAMPMGLATIVNGFLAFGPELIGGRAIAIAHGLWWLDAALSVACGLAIPYFMFTRQQHSIEKLTAVWLLPIVACEVAAASAGLLAPHLGASEAFLVLVLGYVLWACSVPLAMSILVLLVLRLALHKLPERDMGVSAWLALGPIGTGALGLLLLGGDAPAIFAANGLAGVGEVAFGLGVIGGIVLWGYGAWWLALALLKTVRYLREGLPFNLGWWGFTFPLAVYTLATLALARTTRLELFAVAGAGFAIALAVFWVIVAARTLHGAWTTTLFVSPCLKGAAVPVRFEADIA